MIVNKNFGRELLQSPIIKITIGLSACLLIGLGGHEGTHILLNHTRLNEEYKDLVTGCMMAFLVWFIYITLFKYFEKREITELSPGKLPKNLIAGMVIGSALQSLIILFMYVNTDFFVISVNRFLTVLPFLVSGLAASIVTQILFVGIIFRVMEEKLGSWLALGVFTFIFGIIHLTVPKGTLVGVFGIAMHAGWLMGASFIYSRSLWLPIGIHFAWDFTQSSVFGASVSGTIADKSLLTTKIEGSPLLTGGYFGPQGSVQGALLCLALGIVLIILSEGQNKIIKPYWKR